MEKPHLESDSRAFAPLEMAEASVPKATAVAACTAMAVFYVAILYSPTLILRLPHPTSVKSFMIRRFVCAAISSIVSAFASALLLPIGSFQAASSIFGVYGIRVDHLAPFTEEVVFRACMIPLLLCGGFKTSTIVFLSPIFFSLAHLNHFLELYCLQNYSFCRAALIVGPQLGYTVIFGSYASFLFIRTGHLLSPTVAHIFCNVMGLPVLLPPRRKGVTILAFLAGMVGFFWLLFPATSTDLYNDRTDNCRCWHGYCSWTSKNPRVT
ncbi:CAAX prenyl protease 2 isoform X3 [Magnolia sinica]|uniref:CAAX prenyl protease 2 isoform X3 n=1 Tax=Magnolia sinica TaxID=86752 RepID=UPI00265AACB7|nr:CAAX prenyl protease 2 isoform X3 [Magnolia sinica]